LAGPAFPLLKEFLNIEELDCYINDGVLYINDIYDPQSLTVQEIKLVDMYSQPLYTQRNARRAVEIESIADSVKSTATYRKKRRRRKRKLTEVKRLKSTDYEEWKVVSSSVDGIELDLRCRPDMQPDALVRLEGNDNIYRVQTVAHSGESVSFDEWQTIIEADIYEPT
jgi:hypothetical protein